MKSLAILMLPVILLSACAAPAASTPTSTPTLSQTDTPILTATATPSSTPTPTNTPKPAWQTAMETQDPQDQFFKVVDGAPTIDRYDIAGVESIVQV